jgi:hypothetical protein
MKKTIEDCLHKTFDLFEYHFSIQILLCSCWVKKPTKLETQINIGSNFFQPQHHFDKLWLFQVNRF